MKMIRARRKAKKTKQTKKQVFLLFVYILFFLPFSGEHNKVVNPRLISGTLEDEDNDRVKDSRTTEFNQLNT